MGFTARIGVFFIGTVLAGACHAGADFAGEPASPAARSQAEWVLSQRDHQGLPFAIVDKRDARLYVFAGSGQLLGAAAALLGLAPGDHAVPGVGQRAPSEIPPFERTTPAGRFASEPGRNLQGEAVVWFDYEAGLAIHRLRPAAASERRPQRLRSDTPDDNRISLGCVVVAVDFYETVVGPVLGRQRGIVYVLPENRAALLAGGALEATAPAH